MICLSCSACDIYPFTSEWGTILECQSLLEATCNELVHPGVPLCWQKNEVTKQLVGKEESCWDTWKEQESLARAGGPTA